MFRIRRGFRAEPEPDHVHVDPEHGMVPDPGRTLFKGKGEGTGNCNKRGQLAILVYSNVICRTLQQMRPVVLEERRWRQGRAVAAAVQPGTGQVSSGLIWAETDINV